MTDSPDDPAKKVIRAKFEIRQGSSNQIEKTASGEFICIWHGQPVYENGRVKRFQTEDSARAFLARCDAAGEIVH
jgi:hypothetical protein